MTKDAFSALLSGGTVLLDGATGSNLMRCGLPRGACTEQWILENPEPLVRLQRAYVRAGTQILYAPTFGANRVALERHGLQDKVREMNLALVHLSRTAGQETLVAGDVTTTGIPLEPNGTMQYHTLFSIYQEQISALTEAGVDLLVLETMLGVEETAAALEAAQSVCSLPVLCSLTIQSDGSAYFDGDCVEAVETLQELGAAAVGVNCSCGPEQLLSPVRRMREVARVPLLVKPNAGMPVIADNGEVVYPMDAAEFVRQMCLLVEAGARIVGGCCGTTPEYIAALRQALHA